VEYVEEQFDKFLEAETRVKRESLADSRVHDCLYFTSPTGHGLKKVDVVFMKKLHKKVNIIPVIGKDTRSTVRIGNISLPVSKEH
jgi:septin 7